MSTHPSLPLAYAIYKLLPMPPDMLSFTAVQAKLRDAGIVRTSEVVRATTRMLHGLGHATPHDDVRRFWSRGAPMGDPGGKIGSTAAFDWTDERKSELRRLRVDERMTQIDIAALWGVSKGTIVGQCNRMGLESPLSARLPTRQRARSGPRPKLPPLRAELLGHGKSYPPPEKEPSFRAAWRTHTFRELAAAFGVGVNTISTWGRNLDLGSKQMVVAKSATVSKPPVPRTTPTTSGARPYTVDYPANLCNFMVSEGRPWMACGCQRMLNSPYCEAHTRATGGGHKFHGGVFEPNAGALNFSGRV